MRHVLYKDKKISDKEFELWKDEDSWFWERFAGIKPQYWVIDYDFSNYPVEPDSDGDARPTKTFLKELTDDVYKAYNKDGTDFVMLLIHEDNWRSSGELYEQFKKKHGITKKNGIWGTNYSNVYHNYHVQYCRWDRDNLANVFGTLYHERHHALDALIATELGININPILGVTAYDRGITHGGEEPWRYIRHKENTASLEKMSPYLKQALAKRQARHDEYLNGQRKTIIKLLEQVVYLYRQWINKKDGVNNK